MDILLNLFNLKKDINKENSKKSPLFIKNINKHNLIKKSTNQQIQYINGIKEIDSKILSNFAIATHIFYTNIKSNISKSCNIEIYYDMKKHLSRYIISYDKLTISINVYSNENIIKILFIEDRTNINISNKESTLTTSISCNTIVDIYDIDKDSSHYLNKPLFDTLISTFKYIIYEINDTFFIKNI